MLLAIETSCDETAVAVLDLDKAMTAGARTEDFLIADVISSQVELHEKYGGVVPELAAREHVLNLPILVRQTLNESGVSIEQLRAVAVTRGPGLKGCLLVGMCFAKALAFSREIPLLALNHMEGHIFAGELVEPEERPELPVLALVVSGGHSMLVHMTDFRNYRIVAKTRDDAAGEAFDKAATLMDLPYPGGPSLARLAAEGDPLRYRFPVGVAQDPESFSFSGLKTAVGRTISGIGDEVKDPQVLRDMAASVESAIVEALSLKTLAACKMFRPRTLLLVGGVAANRSLRKALMEGAAAQGIKFCVPPQRWCTDNAAMMGLLGVKTIERRLDSYSNWSTKQNGLLGPDVSLDVGVLPRWPLDKLFVQ